MWRGAHLELRTELFRLEVISLRRAQSTQGGIVGRYKREGAGRGQPRAPAVGTQSPVGASVIRKQRPHGRLCAGVRPSRHYGIPGTTGMRDVYEAGDKKKQEDGQSRDCLGTTSVVTATSFYHPTRRASIGFGFFQTAGLHQLPGTCPDQRIIVADN